MIRTRTIKRIKLKYEDKKVKITMITTMTLGRSRSLIQGW